MPAPAASWCRRYCRPRRWSGRRNFPHAGRDVAIIRVVIFGFALTRAGLAAQRTPSLLRLALRLDIGDAYHVGGAGNAERDAGDDDHALAGLGKTVAKSDGA